MLNRFWKSFVLIVLIFNLTAFNAIAVNTKLDAAKTEKKAVEFTLKDQFNQETKFSFPRQKPSVLTIADKEDAANDLEPWIRALYGKYADQIEYHGVAELSAVPGIAKGIVRNILKKKSKTPVMLDWSGEVSKNYDYKKNSANLIVIDRQGNIVARQIGAMDDSKLAQLTKEIDALLK